MRRVVNTSLLVVAGVGAIAVGYATWVVTMGIPLRVDVREGSIWVDTQVFGEYYSSISRIRLTETATGHTVWEVESTANNGTSPVWAFALKPGRNSVPEQLGDFRIVIANSAGLFELIPGHEYRVRVGGKTRLNRNSRRFTAPAPGATLGTTYNNALNLTVTTPCLRKGRPAAEAERYAYLRQLERNRR